MSDLAIMGGQPIRHNRKPWPTWPQSTADAEQAIIKALQSGRWTLSGLASGDTCFEQRFAREFAKYNNVPYCIPTSSGTTALISALSSLNVGFEDEVIIPGLTWVACPMAVAALGAIPVLVDINQWTLCLDPLEVENAITSKTRAIMAVHLYANMADMDALLEIANRHCIPLIEDSAQAHGAIWRGRRAGSIGHIGTFSMQQGKVLTSGEGGACITSDPELADRIERLRANGRRLIQNPKIGRPELCEVGGIFGQNFCLSEIQASLLIERLSHLESELDFRAKRIEQLDAMLDGYDGVRIQAISPGVERRTVYHLPVYIDPLQVGQVSSSVVASALSAELGFWIHPPYEPLSTNRLYSPLSALNVPLNIRKKMQSKRITLPKADEVFQTYVVLHHPMFLADDKDIRDIADAFAKVIANGSQLAKVKDL